MSESEVLPKIVKLSQLGSNLVQDCKYSESVR